MRHPKYPKLNVLAAKLGTTPALTTLDEKELLKVRAIAQVGSRITRKNMALTLGGGGYSSMLVKLSLGQLVTLGYIYKDESLSAWAKALRFADMARMRFWKYRMRGATEPTDADLNFSVARAKLDLQFETRLNALLDEEEALMLEAGIIEPAEQMQAKRVAMLKNRPRSKLTDNLTKIDVRLEAMHTSIQALVAILVKQSEEKSASPAEKKPIVSDTGKLMRMEKEMAGIREVMNTLSERMNAVLFSINRPPMPPASESEAPLKGMLNT